jgi:hypothetical protein
LELDLNNTIFLFGTSGDSNGPGGSSNNGRSNGNDGSNGNGKNNRRSIADCLHSRKRYDDLYPY